MNSRTPLRVSGFLMAPLMIACLATSTGCMNTSSGTPINAAAVSKIEKGKTTRAEVEAMLGKPDMVVMMGDGKRCLSYSYSATKIGVNPATAMLGPFAKASGSSRVQTLQVFVNKEAVVEDYELSDNTRDISGSSFNHQSTTR